VGFAVRRYGTPPRTSEGIQGASAPTLALIYISTVSVMPDRQGVCDCEDCPLVPLTLYAPVQLPQACVTTIAIAQQKDHTHSQTQAIEHFGNPATRCAPPRSAAQMRLHSSHYAAAHRVAARFRIRFVRKTGQSRLYHTALQCRARRADGEAFLAGTWFSTYNSESGNRLARAGIYRWRREARCCSESQCAAERAQKSPCITFVSQGPFCEV
jgi:hypothetical protein